MAGYSWDKAEKCEQNACNDVFGCVMVAEALDDEIIAIICLKTTDQSSQQSQYSHGPGVSLNQILIHEYG